MLPNPLVSVYQQYKQDTDSVASWLASTAKACGYPSDLPAVGGASQKPSGRLKGKARSNAKKNNKGNNAGQAKPKVSKYTVAIKDFIPLAEFVAASQKPTVTVPESFSTTINRVIDVRAGFGQQLGDYGPDLDDRSDAKHSYFVGILEKVRDVLKPRMSAASAPSAGVSGSAVDIDSLTNRFKALAVYEPSQEFLDAPVLERPQRAGEDEVDYEAESENTLEDALVAYTMMINDLNKIRSYIQWVWTNHRSGMFDSATAAVATNTAIDLARNLMEDIIPLFNDHGGTWGMANKFYLMCCLREGFAEEDLHDQGTFHLNGETYDIANSVYFVAYRILASLRDVLSPHNLPLIKEGMFGTYDPTRDRGTLPGEEKHREDHVLLMEYFTELEMDKTREIPFHLVFAAQIYLDIHHVLRDQAGNAFAYMVEQTTFMDNDLNNHLEFHEKLKIEHWPASNDHMLREVQRKIKWVASDPVYKVKIKQYYKQGMVVPDSMQPHRLLQYSPLLSGLVLFHFRAEIYDIGIAIANAWGSIAYSWHLYNALQSEKLLDGPWEDMDIAETVIGESNFYAGSRPHNPRDYFSRFCLQMGVSAAHFTGGAAGRRRPGAALGSRAGPRGIKDGVPVARMFMDRYLRRTGQVDWKPEHVDDIIARSEFEMEGSAEEGTLMMGQIDDPQKLRAKKKTARQRKKTAHGARLSPDQLIQPLTLSLQAESMELAFPYLLMYRWCWKLLRAVKDACDPLLRQLYTPAYMERENQLPFVIGYIFLAAGRVEGAVPDMRLLEVAAQAVNGLIGSGAGRFVIGVMKEILHFDIQFAAEDAEDDSD